MSDVVLPLNVPRLTHEWRTAQPYPHILIEPFLDPDFAREVAAAYPTYETARAMGEEFAALNEKGKIQVTKSERFPAPVQRLHEALASRELLDALGEISGMPRLLADPDLAGGGMHMTGPQGRLDVHVDFNFVEAKQLHRRINILVYLNPVWEDAWGGGVEMWDRKVQHRYHRFTPKLNRCVIFETSHTSYHGVELVACPPGTIRKSFAAYYYTKEPPPGWTGEKHSTIFRARPDEKLRGYVLMPAQKAAQEIGGIARRARARIRKALGDETEG